MTVAGDRRGEGAGALLWAVVAVAACCALPFLLVGAGGLIAAFGGLAARYWPLTVLGVVAAAWAGVEVGRLLRARNRSLRGRRERGS
jgi:hypothetical protein